MQRSNGTSMNEPRLQPRDRAYKRNTMNQEPPRRDTSDPRPKAFDTIRYDKPPENDSPSAPPFPLAPLAS